MKRNKKRKKSPASSTSVCCCYATGALWLSCLCLHDFSFLFLSFCFLLLFSLFFLFLFFFLGTLIFLWGPRIGGPCQQLLTLLTLKSTTGYCPSAILPSHLEGSYCASGCFLFLGLTNSFFLHMMRAFFKSIHLLYHIHVYLLCSNAAVNGYLELTLLKGRQRFDTISTLNLERHKFWDWWIFTLAYFWAWWIFT